MKRWMTMFFTYGIGMELTPREKRTWLTFFYMLCFSQSYYAIKDIFRTEEEGPWSLWQFFKREVRPEEQLTEARLPYDPHYDDEMETHHFDYPPLH